VTTSYIFCLLDLDFVLCVYIGIIFCMFFHVSLGYFVLVPCMGSGVVLRHDSCVDLTLALYIYCFLYAVSLTPVYEVKVKDQNVRMMFMSQLHCWNLYMAMVSRPW